MYKNCIEKLICKEFEAKNDNWHISVYDILTTFTKSEPKTSQNSTKHLFHFETNRTFLCVIKFEKP